MQLIAFNISLMRKKQKPLETTKLKVKALKAFKTAKLANILNFFFVFLLSDQIWLIIIFLHIVFFFNVHITIKL